MAGSCKHGNEPSGSIFVLTTSPFPRMPGVVNSFLYITKIYFERRVVQ
jgi:hypothetical protein